MSRSNLWSLCTGRDRDYVANDYRFGYNGMEKDNAVKGNGNSYTTEFRQYDPRLGRWLSLDPLMHEFPWMSPYVAFNNNPIYFIDPLGLEGGPPDKYTNPITGESRDWKEGDVFVTESGEALYRTSDPNDPWKRKVTNFPDFVVYAPKYEMVIVAKEERSDISIWQKIGNFFRSADNKIKGTSKWTFGIEFKTRDGVWNGNTANPVALKDADKVWTLYWDDIEELTTALKALDRELPKEFRENPDYSGPGKFIDEAKKWIGPPNEKTYKPNKQEDGKNWDVKENRLEKQTSQKIYVRVWTRDEYLPNIRTTRQYGPFDSVEEMKQKYPNVIWNSEQGYWESD